jgi:hypothetical protein
VKRLLFILLGMFPLSAQAVPTGCFVEDGTAYCSSRYFYASDCDQFNMTSYWFGNYINGMCSYVNTVESDNAAYAAALSVAIGQRDACLSASAATEKNRQEWIAYANYQVALVKKAKKVCGAKCRRIK